MNPTKSSEEAADEGLYGTRAPLEPRLRTGPPSHDEMVSYNLSDVTAIVPCLNEAGGIVGVLNELKDNGVVNILVVDGHSTDGSADLAREWGANVITQDGAGKVRAVKSGLKQVTTDLVLVVDADLTYDISSLGEMLDLIQEADEVICARTNGRNNIPRVNRLGNRIINSLFNTLFGTRLTDVLSGMYLVRTRVLRHNWMESEGFSLEVEIASAVASTSRKLREVEGNYRNRVGKAKLKRRHGLSILADAIKLTWRYNPALFIFAIFSALFIPAVYITGWVGYRYFILGQRHYVWAILGAITGGVALISFSLAVVSLYLKRFEYRILERLDRLEGQR
jgi:dolichol-phosphate hexosyltransferase